MAVSVEDIVAKRHNQKLANYHKLKEAVNTAFASENNWSEVEINDWWKWEHYIKTPSITVIYRPPDQYKKQRSIIVHIN